MIEIYDFALLVFTSLFTMLNPLGVIPVYNSLTNNLPHKETKLVAYKAVFTATATLISFALFGNLIFEFFGISIHSLRIVGGVILFMVGYDLLQARKQRTKESSEEVADYAHDIAITPLGIPIICGPGAMTVVIVLYNDAADVSQKIVLFGGILIIMLTILISLLFGRRIIQALGENGNKVIMRIMGLIVMVISVEFFFAGLKPILRDILKVGQ